MDAPLKAQPAGSLHEVDALLPIVADHFSVSVDAIFKGLLKLQRWVYQDVLPSTDESNSAHTPKSGQLALTCHYRTPLLSECSEESFS